MNWSTKPGQWSLNGWENVPFSYTHVPSKPTDKSNTMTQKMARRHVIKWNWPSMALVPDKMEKLQPQGHIRWAVLSVRVLFVCFIASSTGSCWSGLNSIRLLASLKHLVESISKLVLEQINPVWIVCICRWSMNSQVSIVRINHEAPKVGIGWFFPLDVSFPENEYDSYIQHKQELMRVNSEKNFFLEGRWHIRYL